MAGSKRPAPVPQNVLRWNNSKWRSGPSQHQPTGAMGVPTLLQYIHSCRRIPTSLELQMEKHWILFLLLFTDFSALRHYRQLHGPDVGTSIGKVRRPERFINIVGVNQQTNSDDGSMMST